MRHLFSKFHFVFNFSKLSISTTRNSGSVESSLQKLEQLSLAKLANNPYIVTPEAWVTTLSKVEHDNVDIIRLNPDIFRHAPRLDLLHRNVTWQLNYRNLQLTKQLTRAEMPGGGKNLGLKRKLVELMLGQLDHHNLSEEDLLMVFVDQKHGFICFQMPLD